MKNWIFILCFVLVSFTGPSHAYEYGIDRLSEPTVVALIQGKKLAVLTHAAGRAKSGDHLIDLLFKNYTLKKIFAPEHGLRTTADETVEDGVDSATGLPIISLYKTGSHAPKPSDLAGIDAIVVDLQDVGLRYYTYIATIAEVMKVAAPLNVEVILLDRPNLLGGEIVEGKTLDPVLAGRFTAFHTVPTRHGMTLGELAQMINTEKKFGTHLTVVPATGWHRENILNALDRPWIPPSPALTDTQQVGLYAIWGTLEDFNLTVGRGKTNEKAFRYVGAPWITPVEAKELADALNALGFQGMTFYADAWLVTRSIYNGQTANGVRVDWNGKEVRTDEVTFKSVSLFINKFRNRLSVSKMEPEMYGSQSFIDAVRAGTPWVNFSPMIDTEISQFLVRRKPYLLY